MSAVSIYEGPTTSLAPDADVIQRHLELLFGREVRGKFALAWIDPSKSSRINTSKVYDVGDIDLAAEEAAAINATPGASFYVRPAVFSEDMAPFGWPKDEDFDHTSHLWCDLDDHDATSASAQVTSTCRPNFVVITGRTLASGEPHKRAHLYWRLAADEGEVIRRGEYVSQLNKAITAKLVGDPASTNPSRLMRLAGTINWAWKDGRMPEFCELIVFPDRPEHMIIDIKRGFLQEAADPVAHQRQELAVRPLTDAQTRDMLGRNRPDALIRAIQSGDQWHNHCCRLVAHYVGRGATDTEILALAPALTLAGFTVADTERDLAKMIAGARGKGFGARVEQEQPIELEFQAAPAEDVSGKLEWLVDCEAVLTDSYLVKGVIGAGAMSIVYGPSNSGKTFFALDIAWHIACGDAWRGFRVKPGAVLYLAAEGGRGVMNRLTALKKHSGIDDAPLALRRAGLDLLKAEADIKELAALADAVKERARGLPLLIVIDTLSRVMAGGDENAPADMTAFIRNVDAIRAHTGAHIMIVHHSGKDAARGARGHSSLRAATDTEIEVQEPETDEDGFQRGVRLAKVTKQRDYQGGEIFAFDLEQVHLGVDQDGDPVTSCVVKAVDAMAVIQARSRTKGLGGNQEIIADAFDDMIGEGLAKPNPAGPGFPDAGRFWTVELSALRRFAEGKFGAERPASAWRDAWKSLIEKRRLFHVNGGIVWRVDREIK